jgi:hypothetical protein
MFLGGVNKATIASCVTISCIKPELIMLASVLSSVMIRNRSGVLEEYWIKLVLI